MEHISTANQELRGQSPAARPILHTLSIVAAYLSFLVPVAMYIAHLSIAPEIPAGERPTPGDGILVLMIVMVGVPIWILLSVLSVAFNGVGFIRREKGYVRYVASAMSTLAIAAVALVIGGLVYIWNLGNVH